MEKKHQVHNLIILDESGSMESIKSVIIQGFNEVVQTIKGIEKKFPEQQHFISFISFNGLGQKFHHFAEPASSLKELNKQNYKPDANTPLFDAMGYSFNKLTQHLKGETNYNVLVTILTDGMENASKEFTGTDINHLVLELNHKGWTFTYIGTDHDVKKMAKSISITNSLTFKKDSDDINNMFGTERLARERYYQKLRSKENLDSDYFNTDNLNK